jgi:DNA-directed RNA polymerase subunit beta'
VDSLFDNGRGSRAALGGGATGLHRRKSLAAMLRGKQGRFRENLLGKRVDYSGRSVIVVGPELRLHQCGLPKTMALELFKPFVLHALVEHHFCANTKSAKRFIERRTPEVWDVLEEVIQGHPVLLNRAPTLHRLGILAFEVVLVEGSAIQLHPLVCSAFNADFDGDQMAVHVPLSKQARDEARTLLMSTMNLLSPANGEPVVGASQEIVLGCYYLTQERPGKKGEGRAFTDTTEAALAYQHGVIDLQARIRVRLDARQVFDAPAPVAASSVAPRALVETTVGRIMLNDALPERLRFKNYALKKEHLRQLIAECYRECGRARTVELADDIKRLGFAFATKAGVTIAVSDVKVPEGKREVLADADARTAELEEMFREGLITESEKYLQTVDAWNEATERVTRMIESSLDPYGSIYTIATSGATKAKFQQIRQLSGMRGLMASPSGRIIEVPIRSNFREGLSVMEYFISSHGARKGLADTSLRTAESGHLTRRLVDVAQDVIISTEDCGTSAGVLITQRDSREMGHDSMRVRLIGRVLAEPAQGFTDLEAGAELTEEAVERLLAAGIQAVRVRSPLTCEARRGLCRKCYGRDLAAHSLIALGAAVGIIAAQSIGEPGTQLTMRTFHTGGIAGAQGDITQGLPRVEELFEARVPKDKAEISEIDGTVEITRDEGTGTRTVRVVATNAFLDEYPLPAGSQVLAHAGQRVQQGQVIARLSAQDDHAPDPVVARTEGEVLCSPDGPLTIRFEECDERSYRIPAARTLTVTAGQSIAAGTPITTGNPDPLAILRVLGREGVQLYLVREIQKVYRNTGVYIDDKHAEVIVRQMLRRVRVDDPGDSDLLPGSLVDRFLYADINARTMAEGGEPATARTVLLGITKASLSTESWLAAASFQETNRVLTRAAIEAQVDHLVGLKENVIIGKLIPAGTGWGAHTRILPAHPQASPRLSVSTAEAEPGREEACYV